ncbi:putative glycoside hydrolase family 74 protein [Rosellinia necatrix]|uniref:Putative glycoside hydrolase family 74 protein n=1 Tax=Rosellinia necatrix TaxID=77044 RepID=A0A1S8A999_ROSNE|nr:putative glycoside hydrolase family 74 protein [Rosellinia necatrix]
MGICASCLGRRRSDSIDEDDVSPLLFDDPNSMHYGGFTEHNMNSQGDPLESQREVEALQRVVARTSNNLVDVFEITPEESQRTHPLIFPGQDARLARYQHILSKLSSDDPIPAADGNQGATAWLLGEEDIVDPPGQKFTIKEGSSGPLVGTFADAVTAVA